MATASLRVRDGQWFPVLEGNATFVYRADVDPEALARGDAPGREAASREPYPRGPRLLRPGQQNAARLRAVGIETRLERGACRRPGQMALRPGAIRSLVSGRCQR